MLNVEMLDVMLVTAEFAISGFALLLSLSQMAHSKAYMWLAVLFVCFILGNLFDMMSVLLINPAEMVSYSFLMLAYTSSFFLPPVLLIYVRALVGEPLMRSSRERMAHFALPVFVAIIAALFLLDREASEAGFSAITQDENSSNLALFVYRSLAVLPYVFYAQCIVYVVLTLFTQMTHRERLKDLFASTEPYEIRWITGMALLFGSYTILNLLSRIMVLSGFEIEFPATADRVLQVLIVLALAIWGLRQSPGGADAVELVHDDQIKYEKSALDTKRATRISGKLYTAMERDHLFRDPNLSLMTLSQHIGVSTNYVSQSLNEHMGMSFFDFVNHWRVEEAKPMICARDQPVTVIAYKVGFNSRSSFYTAFKKNTGMTPRNFSEYDNDTVENPI